MKAFVLNCFLMPIVLLAGIGALFSCTPATGPIVVNSSISVRSKTIDKMVLSWSQAQDVNGNNETLEYQVISSSSSDIETVSDVNKNGRTIRQWAQNYTSVEISLDGTEKILYYNVMVRDSVGTISFYSPLAVDFTDKTAPVVEDKAVSVTELTSKSLRLNWQPATDNNTVDKELVYIVMKSTSDNLNDESAYYNNTSGRHTCFEKASVLTVLLESLDPGTNLWFNVFARDSNGNVTPYTAVQATLLLPVTVTVTADPASVVCTWPLSADTAETVALTVSGSEAGGIVAAASPLWTNVVRWAAAYSGNAVGQGMYQFENLYNGTDDTVSLTPLSETDAKLLSNALTEYTNTYQVSAGSDGCCYLTEAGAVVRTAAEAASAVVDETAAGFRLSADESGNILVKKAVAEE